MDDAQTDPQLYQLDAGPGASPAPSPAGETSGVFAVYDKAELRYIGGTHPTRKAANAMKSERAKGDDRGRYEVREV